MIRKITLLFLACLTGVITARAQQCATADIHRELMAKDPAYAALHKAADKLWTDYQRGQANLPAGLKIPLSPGDSVFEIPVVVHIIHTGGGLGTNYNPTDNQIINTINYLNQSFEASWNTYPQAGAGGTKVHLRFALAKRTPTCSGITNGINRINGATALGGTNGPAYDANGVNRQNSNGITDATLKAISMWPPTEYYNIWVVNKIDGNDLFSSGGIAGYAYLPPAPPTLDGTVLVASQMNVNRTTLVHEMGHAFGLYHTFEDPLRPPLQGPLPVNTCPAKSNPYDCTTNDDLVCDTDPSQQLSPQSCPSSNANNPCTGFPYGVNGVQNNFMNYTTCTNKFTPGQRDRMMFSFKNYRGSLITSLGATTLTPVIPAACTPAVTNPNTTNTGPARIVITQGTGFQDTLMHMNTQGYSGDGNLAYIDNTCKHRVTLTSGVPYQMTVVRPPFSNNTEQVHVYIDYNNDGDFLDVGEQLFAGTNGTSNEISFTFTPPLSGIANCTEIRMRVRSDRASATPLTSCNNHTFGQTEDYSVLIKGGGTSVPTKGLVKLQNPPEGGNPSCFGANLKFRATIPSTVAPVHFRWQKKNGTFLTTGPSGQFDSTWSASNFNNNDTVWLRVAYAGACGIDTTISDTIVVQRRTTIPPAVSIVITKGTNPGCPDDTVRFTAVSQVNPGGNPTYLWHVGSALPRSTGNIPYFDTVLADNETVFVEMISSAGSPCANPGSATSNSITYRHTNKLATALVALVSGTNPGCAGQTLGFAAVTTNEGKAPTYQWKVNNINAGSNSPTFSGVFNNGDQISYVLTSNSTCVLPANRVVTSNSITVQHQQLIADVQIAIVGGTNTACQGHPVVFSANTANSGANPSFEWMINNVPVANSNSPIFSSSTLSNGDQVACIMIATDPCVSNTRDTSAAITMTIKPSAVPSVTIAITTGKNPWCLDSLVEFTATPTNAGSNPNFEWLVNGFATFNGPVFANSAYLNGDVVVCRLNTTDGACYLPDTVYSAPETMIRSTLPEPPLIHLVGNMLITNKAGTYRWWGPAGLYTTGTDGRFHPSEKGMYMAVTDNNGCWSKPSNILLITMLDINTIELPAVEMYPNPSKGELVLDWGNAIVNMTISIYNPMGQVVLEDVLTNGSKKTLNLSSLANGSYYIVMKDPTGNKGTAKITVNR